MSKNQGQKTVAVLFGGVSFEHEISILTGVFVLNILKSSNYKILPVYVDTEGDFYTAESMFDVNTFKNMDEKNGKKKFIKILFARNKVYRFQGWKELAIVDCALNCCHGGWGEGGGVSALMDVYDIPLASPDLALSSAFMDKRLTKKIIAGMGIPSARYYALTERAFTADTDGEIEKIERLLGYPVILKPARLGSSIGIAVARDRGELKSAIKLSFAYDDGLLIEEYLDGKRDINCAAYGVGDRVFVSACEEPFSRDTVLSFKEKYEEKTRSRSFPAQLPDGISEKIRSYTERIYKELNFTGIVRADYLLVGKEVYFNEMNTVPGSLAYYLFSEKFTIVRDIFISLVEDAITQKARKKKPLRMTGVLHKVNLGGGKTARKGV